MLPDNPHDLIAGKDYDSEGIAQRYLTALQIGGPEYGYIDGDPLQVRDAVAAAGESDVQRPVVGDAGARTHGRGEAPDRLAFETVEPRLTPAEPAGGSSLPT
jgi:hypothetical protein